MSVTSYEINIFSSSFINYGAYCSTRYSVHAPFFAEIKLDQVPETNNLPPVAAFEEDDCAVQSF